MTSGSSLPAARALCALVATAAACASWAAAAAAPASPDWGVEQLMRRLAEVASARARFVERRHVAILTQPVESSGALVYVAPGRLEKHVLRPRPESLVLDGDRLVLESPAQAQRREFVIQEHPVLWAIVESMRSTLAGDLATLRRFYEVSLAGGERRWRLTLRPSEPGMRDVVSEIRISGTGNVIRRVEYDEAGGDRSVMTITPETRDPKTRGSAD